MKNLSALVLLCFGLMLAGTLAAGEAGPDLLTPAEQAWLAEHPVLRVVIDPRWAPVESFDEAGVTQGISPTYLKRLEKILGVRFEITTDLPRTLSCDLKCLRQLLVHLLDNAVKFTERGEKVLERNLALDDDVNHQSLLTR